MKKLTTIAVGAVLVLGACSNGSGSEGANGDVTTTTAVQRASSTTTEQRPATSGRPTTTRPDVGPNARYLTRADFGKDWPLTVDSGVVHCTKGSAVTFETGGDTYAVNGTARGFMEQEGWEDITDSPIWAENPDYPGVGLKIDIGVIIDAGLDLCD